MLNRCVVTVTAKEPFLHWLRSILREDATTLNEVNLDASAYLLPDYQDDDERQLLLARYYDLIFERELFGWWTEEEDWPQRLQTARDLPLPHSQTSQLNWRSDPMARTVTIGLADGALGSASLPDLP